MSRFSLARRIQLGAAAVVAVAVVAAVIALWPGKGAHYTAVFKDASGLVPRNDVRINDTVVGHVTSIKLDGLKARVNFQIGRDIVLPDATRAEIHQTSMLGEYFVALVPAGEGRLPSGAVIPVGRSRRLTDLETIVRQAGDLTAQVNVDNIDRIISSLDTGLAAGPGAVGNLFDSMARTAGSLSGLRDSINATIDSVDALSARLAPETGRLRTDIDRFAAGAAALATANNGYGPFIDKLDQASASLAGLLQRNHDRLVRATPELRATLQEVVDNLGGLADTIKGLPGFNRGWACATDGSYLNFVFPLVPEVAALDLSPHRCDNVAEGPRGRQRPTEIRILPGLDSLTINDPLGTGNIDLGAGSANANLQSLQGGGR